MKHHHPFIDLIMLKEMAFGIYFIEALFNRIWETLREQNFFIYH